MDKKEYQKLLDSHDWGYEYAEGDDYRKGKAESERLNNLRKGNKEFEKMYAKKFRQMFPPK